MTTVATVSPFRDSAALRDQPDVLRAHLAEDGYLFLSGLLDRDRVADVRARMLDTLAGAGWLAPGSDPADARPGPTVFRQDGQRDGAVVHEAGWYDGYVPIQRIEALHALAHDRSLVGLMRAVFDGDVLTHPRKVIRITFPGDGYPTPPHQDLAHSSGLADVLTAWVPIGDCPMEMGGLWVLRGSARGGLRPQEAAEGVGGAAVAIHSEEQGDWIGGDYRMGDVLVFHSLTIHMAPANESRCLRLSADFRYQSIDDPVKATWLQPHYHYNGWVPPWSDLTAGWSSTAWIDVPSGVKVRTALTGEPLRSRLIPLAPSVTERP